MLIQNLYNELQLNPRNKTTYRKLLQYYAQLGRLNEADAFADLIRKKFDVDHSLIDQKQSSDNPNHT